MITQSQFSDRCDRLYDNMKTRFKARYWKSGKRIGTLKTPGRELPFDRLAIRAWLLQKVGFNAIPCPYCGIPIDILGLHMDHIVPVSRGGALGLSNLEPTCAGCNRQKGELTHEEFSALLAFMRTLPIPAQADIQKRLRGSGRFFPKYEKRDSNAIAPARVPRYRSPQITMEEATF